jgi:hypothetical protein
MSDAFNFDKFLKIATALTVGMPGDIPVAVESGEATSASLVVEATTRGGVGADLFWLMIFRRSARERADVLVTLALEPRCLERLEDRFGGICSAG